MPNDIALPPIWLLGSSGYSAQLAAMVGAGFSFAHHFSDYDAVAAMRRYREQFQAVGDARTSPHAILGCAVVCADSDAEAERLATTLDLNWVRRARGEYLPLASPEEAQAYPYSPVDRERIKRAPRAPVRRRARDRARAARAADRSHQGRRADDHDHDLRPRGAAALIRAAGGSVRAARRLITLKKQGKPRPGPGFVSVRISEECARRNVRVGSAPTARLLAGSRPIRWCRGRGTAPGQSADIPS